MSDLQRITNDIDHVKNRIGEVVHRNKFTALGAGIAAAIGASIFGKIGSAIGGALGGAVGTTLDSHHSDDDHSSSEITITPTDKEAP